MVDAIKGNSFPYYFPDKCPPSDAENCNGSVYRAIPTKPKRQLKKHHFESPIEGTSKKNWPKTPKCEKCAVSVFRNFDEKDIIIKLRFNL